ncbi:MAG: hypothetical protein DRP79_07270 [Planctomycetota bacterium]|nr:MAG: hypothetical protein DRP79_07270 [Planctomycetota bacterium]
MSLDVSQKRRAVTVTAAIAVALLLLVGRLYQIQILSSEEFSERAQRQYKTVIEELPPRGDIFCMDGTGKTLLATTVLRPALSANPRQIIDRESLACRLSEILHMDRDALLAMLRDDTLPDGRPRYYVLLARHLTDKQAEAVRALNAGGLTLKDEPKRVYPQGRMLGTVLGITGVDKNNLQNKGLEGLELYYDEILRGEPGYRELVVDALGNGLKLPGCREVPAKKGGNLLLTINSRMQRIVEEELRAAFHKWKPASATAIVMDPYTGDILAMANLPDFDPNDPCAYPESARRNRAVTDSYEPGSTFKPLIGCAVLEERLATLDTSFKCFGPVRGRTIGDHASGWLSMRDVIVRSSNRGAAWFGVLLDENGMKLRPWVRRFRFGEPTGVDMPGEVGGRVTAARDWTGYSTTSVPFGQEIAVTPLQLVRAFCAIPNGGLLVRPRIVKAIVDDDGNVIRETGNDERVRVMSEETARRMRTVLEGVVSDPRGTGHRSRLKEYRMAGKTGTAQKAVRGEYSHSTHVGYFVAFAPVEQPRICVLVVMNEPKGRYYGGTVAAPAASRIVLRSLKSMGVPERGAGS